MKLFKSEKDSDKELVERSERLGVEVRELLDFNMKNLCIKTINKFLNILTLFYILSYFKYYLNYKVKTTQTNLLMGIYINSLKILKNNFENIWEKIIVVVKSDNID